MIHPVTVVTLDLNVKTKVRDKGGEIERYDLETARAHPHGLLYAHSTPNNKHVTRHISHVLPSLNLQVTRFNWRSGNHPYGAYDYYIDIIGEVEQNKRFGRSETSILMCWCSRADGQGLSTPRNTCKRWTLDIFVLVNVN